MFKENYRTYDKEEFLIDSDIEFYKIKKILEKNPKILKDDPLIGLDYLKVISLIKRHKLPELSSNEFAPEDLIDSTYYNPEILEAEKALKLHLSNERLRREQQIDEGAGGDRFEVGDEETEVSVRQQKKIEERNKQKIFKQFDSLSQQYEKSMQVIQ